MRYWFGEMNPLNAQLREMISQLFNEPLSMLWLVAASEYQRKAISESQGLRKRAQLCFFIERACVERIICG
jgi:hypothetical protein